MMKRMVKKMCIVGLLVLMSQMVIGCSQSTEEVVVQEKPLKIGLLRIDDSLPFYIAEEEGLFEKYGVDVELIGFSSGKDQALAMESGELDGMMTDMVVQGLIKKGGTDTKVVALSLGATAQEGRFLVVAAPGSEIASFKDLAGKKIAISKNTMMDYLMESFSKLHEMDYSSLDTVNMPDLMLRTTTLLEGNDIDAAILPDPLAAFAVAEGARVIIDDTDIAQNLSQSVVVMAQNTLDTKMESVANMMKAYNEAIELVNQSPEDYRAFCLQKANVPESLTESYPTPQFTANALPSEENVQLVMSWLLERELIPVEYGYDEMVYEGFADEQ